MFRHKLFTLINIAGLALGMSVGLFIIAMLRDLTRFDSFHGRGDRIYRITSETLFPGERPDHFATTVLPLSDIAEKDVGGVEKVVRIQRRFNPVVKQETGALSISGYFAGEDFFSVFSFPLLMGSTAEVLAQPYSIVITRQAAIRLFGDGEPLGKIVATEPYGNFTITGVMEDVPLHSHLQFEALASFSTIDPLEKKGVIPATVESWRDFSNNYVYLLLAEDASPGEIENVLNRAGSGIYTLYERSKVNFELQNIRDIVPGIDLSRQIGPKMLWLPIIIFVVLAIIVLASASFNYANLSVARALRRMKEVGIRKVAGGSRKQIFFQFLIEACVLSFFSMILSVLLFVAFRNDFLVLIPQATNLFRLDLSLPLVVFFICFSVVSGIMAGWFPSWFLSGVNVIQAMRKLSGEKIFTLTRFRKALVVFQFAFSLILITGVMVVYRQYQFAVYYDYGFNQENVLVIPLPSDDSPRYQTFKNELSKNNEVSHVGFASEILASYRTWQASLHHPRGDSAHSYTMSVDQSFIDQMGFELVAGKYYNDGNVMAKRQIVVNESFVREWNFHPASTIVGEVFEWDHEPLTVIGVIKDFHYTHLEEPLKSFFFHVSPEEYRYAYVTLSSASPDVMKKVNLHWNKIYPDHTMDAFFLGDNIRQSQQFFKDFMKIFGFLAVLTIAVACLGFLGMIVFTVEVRLKEIGIRKVLGATVRQITYLLSIGFARLIAFALLIFIPFAMLVFTALLENFAYHISVGFVELGTSITIIAVLTFTMILSQTIKASRTNPVNILKEE